MESYKSVFDLVVSEPLQHDSLLVHTDESGITTLALNAPSVNLFTRPFYHALNDWLTWLYHDPATRAVLLTSNVPNIFTGGFDVKDFMATSYEDFETFWNQVQRSWLIMNGFRKPIAVVITGTAPGMGCGLSIASDYRVMVRGPRTESGEPLPNAKPFRIGLNECAFGLYVPEYMQGMYAHLLGSRQAELMSMRGEMVTPDVALAIGLVDELVDTKAAGMTAATRFLQSMLTTPISSFQNQKIVLRRRFMEPLISPEQRKQDTELYFKAVSDDVLQQALAGYVQGLHSKKS